MLILGLSAYYHDAAACLIADGDVVAAAQEERFTRLKHDASFPRNAIAYCLTEGGISPSDLDYVVFYDKPFLKFERIVETYMAYAPRGLRQFATSMPAWTRDKLFQKSVLEAELRDLWGTKAWLGERLLFSEHHISHAASAFFPSPFEEAAVLTMDGVGEWATTSLSLGRGNSLTVLQEIHFPHSLGLLYSAFTYYTGFKVNSGEYKVMGLAPYGEPKYVQPIKEHLIDIKDDGSFAINMRYFNYGTGLTMTNDRFHKLFGGKPREPESEITQREMDLAASVQAVVEEAVLKLAQGAVEATGQKNLCLAGGVALNCVANGKLVREQVCDGLWIQPAAGDAGGALGAALAIHHMMLGKPRTPTSGSDAMKASLLGPSFAQTEIENCLTQCGAVFDVVLEHEMIERTAHALADGKVVGWYQGRMEFGPRALGARSILADPRSPDMQRVLNQKIKHRESFRPFAPSILLEDVGDWFELEQQSPYMLLVAQLARHQRVLGGEDVAQVAGLAKLNVPRSCIPAVTHVDYSARVHTVDRKSNPLFHALLMRFKELTGCPVLINTSFNVRGEPIVCSPDDAYRCFMGTEIDLLVLGRAILRKANQPGTVEAHVERALD